MGKPACSKSPGQQEIFLRALVLLLFCRHGKDLHGQSRIPGKDTHGSCSPRVQGGYNHGRAPGRCLEQAEDPLVAAVRLRQYQRALGPPRPEGRAGSIPTSITCPYQGSLSKESIPLLSCSRLFPLGEPLKALLSPKIRQGQQGTGTSQIPRSSSERHRPHPSFSPSLSFLQPRQSIRRAEPHILQNLNSPPQHTQHPAQLARAAVPYNPSA